MGRRRPRIFQGVHTQPIQHHIADALGNHLFAWGVVLGQGLRALATHSVGQSFIGDHVISYCGDQYLRLMALV